MRGQTISASAIIMLHDKTRRTLSPLVLIAILITTFCCNPYVYGFSFTPGHFYATQFFENTISEYDSSGNFLSSINIPSSSAGGSLRGLCFGPDNLLYVVVDASWNLNVIAVNSSGSIEMKYQYPGFAISGNATYGRIDFDKNGHFFVSGGSGIAKFDTGIASSGAPFSGLGGVFDIKVMPDGNMLAVTSYDLYEVNPGGITRTIATGTRLVDARGVEYDSVNNVIYVSMLGYSDFFDRILKFNAATGALLGNVYYWYACDLFIDSTSRLIAGSSSQVPGIFNKDLVNLGSFTGSTKTFITQYTAKPAAPPIAIANGPYTIYAGDTLTLNASGSTDDDNDIISYQWDLDDNNSFETDAGNQPVFDVNFAYLQSLGLSPATLIISI